ncbi:MAG: argininosuccinate lyase [Clostridia bacterium]|nr:argininosuccinate lyase [Clostridia bacterium]
MKLWEGRFDKPTAPDADVFNESLSFDKKLYRADITASVAHATMLGKCNVISEEESNAIVEGLNSILSDVEEGKLEITGYEDIHSFVENVLVSRIGDAGKKLHTARSRNDQVATDFRIYVRESALQVKSAVRSLIESLLALAKDHFDDVMPGYTHLRKAQPVCVSQFFNAYAEMFLRDMDRLNHVYKEANVMPLGSGALAGTSYPVDRTITMELLGFDGMTNCSLDGVSDRDFVAEYLFACSMIMAHLSRLCEDTILYTTEEFGFIEIADAYSTGSSIMPQKKNPDIPELVRGKTGRVYGHLMGLLTTVKGIPLAYNKDLQEDKECLFDTETTVLRCVGIYAEMLKNITLKSKRMEEAAGSEFTTATDIADYLAKRGVPFRNAHAVTGKIVRHCIEQNKTFLDLTVEDYKTFSPIFEEDILSIVDARNSANSRIVTGGSSSSSARATVASIEERLKTL